MDIPISVQRIDLDPTHTGAWAALDVETARLTTDHAASSYGLPVIVWGDRAYGPGDFTGTHGAISRRNMQPGDEERIRAAGWRVSILDDAEADRWSRPEQDA